MCGIVGIYNINGSSVDPRVLLDMTDIQQHRGPDHQRMRLFSLKKRKSCEFVKGYFPDGKLEGGVGFNRLSIVDLSDNGHQPMCNGNASVFIVFNGEAYNAFEYRSELAAAGFRFRSTTDTEVILYLFELYGFAGMLERLNGMFAICIVDLNRQEVYLARDRMGIKPLYWYEYKGTFLFSSEVKSFLYHPSFQPELDVDRVDEYFAFRYCAGDGFLMKGVHQLEPGHWIILRPNGWRQHRYWIVPDGSKHTDLSFDSALQKLEKHLQRSVQLQLLSDVKLGCQLSGGIDSSLINMFAAKYDTPGMDAFSIIFDDPQFSEEMWIDKAASRAEVRSHKYTLDSNYFFDNLGTATWHLDQPLNHPNSIGIFYLAEKASSLVTVLLSGEGADELLGGYTRLYYASLLPKLRHWSPILARLPYIGPRLCKKFGALERMDHVDWFIADSAFQGLDHLLSIRPAARFDKVLSERRAIFEEGNGDNLRNCLKYDLRTYLVDLLVRQDKMTMAHSMENRVPFLDHELVTFVRNLAPEYLVKAHVGLRQAKMRNTKVILKAIALKYFDSDFVYRPKSGFALPLKSYFSHPRFKPIMEDELLPGMRKRGVVKADVVERWWHNIEMEGNEVSESVWICVAFEVWAQQYLDGRQTFMCRSMPSRVSSARGTRS